MALSALTRNVGLILPIVVAVWFLFVTRGRWQARARSAGLVVLPAAAVIVLYLVTASLANGESGLTEMGGWNLYGRVGQFADCHKFTPPKGTQRLCEATPPGQRPGPFFYVWETGSPARLVTGQRVEADNAGPPGRFARAAILAQPLDYARAVTKDMVRFIDPTVGTDRANSGTQVLDFGFDKNSQYTQGFESTLRQRYTGVGQRATFVTLFRSYQHVLVPGGLGITLLILLSLSGLAFGRGPARSVAALLGVTAFLLCLGSVATWGYDIRYAVPPLGALAGCAALGWLSLANRRVSRDAPAVRRRGARPRLPDEPTSGLADPVSGGGA
jgi:4-amino-4-deoxy-L-arabinose transferase-like glycosyltransferase